MARRVLHGGCVGRSLSTNTRQGRRNTSELRGMHPHQNEKDKKGQQSIKIEGFCQFRQCGSAELFVHYGPH